MAEKTLEEKRALADKIQRAQAIIDSQHSDAPEEPTVVEKGLRAMGWDRAASGGMGLPTLIEKLSGKQVVKPGEREAAMNLTGDYPSTSDMLQRADVLNDHPMLRAGAGFIGDVASSPTTYAGGAFGKMAAKNIGGPAVKAISMALNPLEAVSRIRSSQLYKKAFEQLDLKALQRGKDLMPSSLMEKMRFRGNMGEARDALSGANEAAGTEIGTVLKEAAGKGATVDMEHVFEPALEEAKKLRKMLSPEAHALADKIEQRVAYMQKQTSSPEFWARYNDPTEALKQGVESGASRIGDESGKFRLTDNVPATREPIVLGEGVNRSVPPPTRQAASGTFEHFPHDMGRIPVDVANQEKSFLDRLIKDSGFDQGTDAALASQEKQAVAGSFRKGIPEAVRGVDPALADRLAGANGAFSASDNSIQKKAAELAKRQVELKNPLLPSAADLLAGGVAAGAGGMAGGSSGTAAGLSLLALKKIRDAAITTSGRTNRAALGAFLGNDTKDLLSPVARWSAWQAQHQFSEGDQ